MQGNVVIARVPAAAADLSPRVNESSDPDHWSTKWDPINWSAMTSMLGLLYVGTYLGMKSIYL